MTNKWWKNQLTGSEAECRGTEAGAKFSISVLLMMNDDISAENHEPGTATTFTQLEI